MPHVKMFCQAGDFFIYSFISVSGADYLLVLIGLTTQKKVEQRKYRTFLLFLFCITGSVSP